MVQIVLHVLLLTTLAGVLQCAPSTSTTQETVIKVDDPKRLLIHHGSLPVSSEDTEEKRDEVSKKQVRETPQEYHSQFTPIETSSKPNEKGTRLGEPSFSSDEVRVARDTKNEDKPPVLSLPPRVQQTPEPQPTPLKPSNPVRTLSNTGLQPLVSPLVRERRESPQPPQELPQISVYRPKPQTLPAHVQPNPSATVATTRINRQVSKKEEQDHEQNNQAKLKTPTQDDRKHIGTTDDDSKLRQVRQTPSQTSQNPKQDDKPKPVTQVNFPSQSQQADKPKPATQQNLPKNRQVRQTLKDQKQQENDKSEQQTVPAYIQARQEAQKQENTRHRRDENTQTKDDKKQQDDHPKPQALPAVHFPKNPQTNLDSTRQKRQASSQTSAENQKRNENPEIKPEDLPPLYVQNDHPQTEYDRHQRQVAKHDQDESNERKTDAQVRQPTILLAPGVQNEEPKRKTRGTEKHTNEQHQRDEQTKKDEQKSEASKQQDRVARESPQKPSYTPVSTKPQQTRTETKPQKNPQPVHGH